MTANPNPPQSGNRVVTVGTVDPASDPTTYSYQWAQLQKEINSTEPGSVGGTIKALQATILDATQHPEKYNREIPDPTDPTGVRQIPDPTSPQYLASDYTAALKTWQARQTELISRANDLIPLVRQEQIAAGKIAKTPEEIAKVKADTQQTENQARLLELQIQAAQQGLDINSPEAARIKNSQGITLAELQNEATRLQNEKDTADNAWNAQARGANAPYLPEVAKAGAATATAGAASAGSKATSDAVQAQIDQATADANIKKAQFGADSVEYKAAQDKVDALYADKFAQQKLRTGEAGITASGAVTRVNTANAVAQEATNAAGGPEATVAGTRANTAGTEAQTAATQLKTQQDAWGAQETQLRQIRDAWARGDISSADEANQRYQDVLTGSTPYQRMVEANTTGTEWMKNLASAHMLVDPNATTMDPGGAIADSFKRAGLKYSDVPINHVAPPAFASAFGVQFGTGPTTGPFSGPPPAAGAPVVSGAPPSMLPPAQHVGDLSGVHPDVGASLLAGAAAPAGSAPAAPAPGAVPPAFAPATASAASALQTGTQGQAGNVHITINSAAPQAPVAPAPGAVPPAFLPMGNPAQAYDAGQRLVAGGVA